MLAMRQAEVPIWCWLAVLMYDESYSEEEGEEESYIH
jgi:hypothetical protein